MKQELSLPRDIMPDISTATDILLREGCKEIYIFGSLAEKEYSETSDIDIAIIGLDKSKFFKVYGELIEKLEHSIDLIGLDYENNFSKKIQESGKLTRVA